MITARVAPLVLFLAGCSQASDNSGPVPAYNGITPGETIQLTGTEPFWGGEVAAARFVYKTPEQPEGVIIPVERFAGNNGVSFSGELSGQRIDLVVTPGQCSDGMSDRSYPFTATLMVGEERRAGCGWSDERPFNGAAQP